MRRYVRDVVDVLALIALGWAITTLASELLTRLTR